MLYIYGLFKRICGGLNTFGPAHLSPELWEVGGATVRRRPAHSLHYALSCGIIEAWLKNAPSTDELLFGDSSRGQHPFFVRFYIRCTAFEFHLLVDRRQAEQHESVVQQMQQGCVPYGKSQLFGQGE